MSAQHRTPPPALPGFVTLCASLQLSLHCHGGWRSTQLSFEKRSSTPQSLGSLPIDPQPKTSFAVPSVWRQSATQLQELHPGRLSLPIAHKPHPGPLWRVTKKSESPPGAASPQPSGETC